MNIVHNVSAFVFHRLLENPDGSWGIAMDRRYWNKLKEDAAEEISKEQCLKSFRYGKEQVPFLPEDIDQLKYECKSMSQEVHTTTHTI